jgi:hypothetical protein
MRPERPIKRETSNAAHEMSEAKRAAPCLCFRLGCFLPQFDSDPMYKGRASPTRLRSLELRRARHSLGDGGKDRPYV